MMDKDLCAQYRLRIGKLENVLEVLVNIIPHWAGQRIGFAELKFVKDLLESNGIEIPTQEQKP